MRTKLVFALAAVMLGSMLALGTVTYRAASRMTSEGATEQLEGLVESSSDALESIVHGWGERVLLIASRTQLRISLRAYRQSGSQGELERIQRIIDDATMSVPSVQALAVYDDRGRPVARAGIPAEDVARELAPRFSPGSAGDVLFLGGAVSEDGSPRVAYTVPLELDDESVGYLYAVLNGVRILDLARDYTGLGETGEIMIVMRDPEGARTLHRVRHPPAGQDTALGVVLRGPEDPALFAIDGVDGVWTEGIVDYRGEPVWAATRHIADTGWGLVVKFDADEKRASIRAFREEIISLALTLGGIGIIVAVVLGFRFARPIHSLAEVATRIGGGDLDARATVKREDEIGLLAHTLNQMAEDLKERVAELHEFQKFFEVSINLLCIAGTDGYFKRTNPAFERALGWDREKLLGHPFLELVHPDDVQATQDEIDKLAQGIPTISFVNRFRCADGSWKWLRWTSYPEPETSLLYAIAREIEGPQDA